MRVFFRVALKIKCLVSILGRQPSLVNANFLDCSNIALIKASLVERKRHTNMRLCEIASQRVNIGCPMTLFSSGRRTKIQTNQQHGNLVSDVTTASSESTTPPRCILLLLFTPEWMDSLPSATYHPAKGETEFSLCLIPKHTRHHKFPGNSYYEFHFRCRISHELSWFSPRTAGARTLTCPEAQNTGTIRNKIRMSPLLETFNLDLGRYSDEECTAGLSPTIRNKIRMSPLLEKFSLV